MATYYWVGGSGTWDNSSKTNWATSSGGSGGFGPPTNADIVNFDSNSGTAATVSVASTAVSLAAVVNKSDITIQLTGNATLSTGTGVFTLTAGTLDVNSNILTVAVFQSNNTNARTIAFGNTGKIVVTGNNNSSLWYVNGANVSLTGNRVVDFTYNGSTGTRTIKHGYLAAYSQANSISVNVTAGTDSVVFSSDGYSTLNNVDFSGFSGTFNFGFAATIYGNLTLATGSTSAVSTNAVVFAGTSNQTITSNSVLVNFPITLNGVGGTWQIQDDLTMAAARTMALTNGTLDLKSKTLTAGVFSSNNSNTRSILFGTGNITLAGNAATIWNFFAATGFTYTGTPTVNCTYSGATGTRALYHGVSAGATETNVVSFNISAGTDSVDLNNALNVDFTGFSGTLVNANRSIYGNYKLSSGMTLTAGNTTTFAATTGPKTITSNGKTIDAAITFNGVGGTWICVDALTLGSTRALTLTNGTFSAGNQNVSIGTFALGAGTKTLTLGSGTWTVAGSGASAWDANTNVTGLTVSASTGTINMTSASAKTFSGGGRTWPTLNQGGAGNLTIAQSNTFANITNTVQPATVRLTAGTTQTVSALSLAGTSGNLITLDTTVAGTKATIYKATGSVSLSFVSIKDIAATGGANFNAFTSNGCVDGGNNTGWDFNSALYPTIYTVRKTKRYFLN